MRTNRVEETKTVPEAPLAGPCCGGPTSTGVLKAGQGLADLGTAFNPVCLDDKAIRKIAYGHFEAGLHCAEVVSKTILELFSKESATHAVRCASGFGGGIAGSMKEACGAFTGGVVALGFILGRDNPDGSLKDCAALIHQFKSRFLEESPSLYCPEIVRAFGEQKNPSGCMKLTARAAVMLADVLKGFAAQGGQDMSECFLHTREKKRLGSCPFSS